MRFTEMFTAFVVGFALWAGACGAEPPTVTASAMPRPLVDVERPARGPIPLAKGGGEVSLAAGTVMVAVRKDGKPGGDGAFGGALYAPNAGNVTYDTLSLGSEFTRTVMNGPGTSGMGATVGDIAGEGFHILGVRWDASSSDSLFEGVSVNQGSGTGGTPLRLSALRAGGGFQESRPWNGAIGPVLVWDRKLSDAEYRQALTSVRERLTRRGEDVEARGLFLIAVGDSITRGFRASGGTNTTFVARAAEARSPNLKFKAYATNGQNIDQFLADDGGTFSGALARVREAKADGFSPVVFLMHGTNGTSNTSLADLQRAWAAFKEAGAIVVAATIPSQDDPAFEGLNAQIRQASGYDHLVDWPASISGPAAWRDRTWFEDGVHPTQAGHEEMGRTLGAVLARIAAER